MIQVKSIRWGANVELRGRESQRRLEGDGILYDEHTGNVEVDDGGCRAIVVPPQGTVIVVHATRDLATLAASRAQVGGCASYACDLTRIPGSKFCAMHAQPPESKSANESPRSPTSADPPPAGPIKARR